MNLDFEEQKKDFISKIENSRIGVLATSINNKVTVRSMSIINIDENILFQTDKRMEKYIQITNNENVGLCINNIQIEGKAVIKGKADKQDEFIKVFSKKHESSYIAYSSMESEVVIEIRPMKVKMWEYIDNEPSIRIIDFSRKKAELNKFIKD